MNVDVIPIALTIGAAAAAFVAGWRAHRWHVLSFSRWPKRPTTTPSPRRKPARSSFGVLRR